MTPERHKEICSLGGKAAHRRDEQGNKIGKAHEFTRKEGQDAGRKGGLVSSQDREFMARIGRLGGQAKKKKAL